MTDVRVLGEGDVADYRRLFLRGLAEHPEAFGTSVEEMQAGTPEEIAKFLTAPTTKMFGAFAGDALIGLVGLQRHSRAKSQHRAHIGPMYVAPEVRRGGVGKGLLDAAIACAEEWQGIEDLVLAVTVGNDAARRLYVAAGFAPYRIDPRYFKIDGRYYDIEWMIRPLNR